MTSKAKKPKRDVRHPIYVRVLPAEHARIVQIVETRGRPHTVASVTAEMITRGLQATPKLTKAA